LKIKTRLFLIASLIGLALLLTGVVLWVGASVEARLQQEDDQIDKVRNDNFEMNILTQEFLLYGSPRIQGQLRMRLVSMGNTLAAMESRCKDNEMCRVREIQKDYQSLGAFFGLLLNAQPDKRNLIAGTMLVKFQDIAAKIRLHDDLHSQEMAQYERNVHLRVVALLFTLAGIYAVFLLFISRRLIVGIDRLSYGMEQVASENLDHRIPEDGKDELAALAQAFNQMSARLQEVINEQKIILGNIGVGVLFLKNRVIIWANPAMTRIFGYATDELVGMTTEVLYPDRESYLKIGEEVYPALAQESLHNFQAQMKRKDGELRWCNAVGQELNPGNPEEGSIWMLEDVTARKQMEAEIVKARNLESLGVLAGGIAHDFNNLFQSLLGNITLAKMQIPESSEAFGFLANAEKAYQQGTKLTSRLIAFSTGGFGRRESIQPAELIKKAVLFQAAGATELEIKFDLADDLARVTVDAGQLEQVVHHLTMNAMEAMPTGGRLRVSAASETIAPSAAISLAAGKYVKISFQDQGCGISKDILPRIFDPYFSTKPFGSKKGMGLGLSLCETIAKKHGGAITVESSPGGGATFHVYLPVTG